MKRRILLILLALIIIFGIFGALTAKSAKKALTTAKMAAGAAKLQDLDAAKAYLKDSTNQFKNTKRYLTLFTPLRPIPLLGWYIADAQRGINAVIYSLEAGMIFADAVTPYADVLGLEGQGTFLGGTAQERLAKAIETLSKVTPQIDQVGEKLNKARGEIDKIESWRYPNFLPQKPGEKIVLAQKTIDQIESFVVDTKPLLLVLPEIMGQDEERTYLILFQNDKELRPTGGFLTAFAYFKVHKGTIKAEGSDDIYKLDDSLTKRISAPAPILKYLANVSNLNIRDSNISPDFYSSMQQFEEIYQYASTKKDIDGIIALDTNFVLDMMKVLGDIEAYGTKFTTKEVDACACPQIIYELERYADEPTGYEKSGRKDIIGVLMSQMMDKAFNAPKSQWPNLLGTTITALREKSLLLYFKDKELQQAVEKLNFGGRLHEYEGDYLHINETNFGGAKSNMYIQEEVKQVVKKGKDDNINKKLTIEYKYPRQGDNCNLERKGGLCLAGIYRDWIRIYVPKGSTIVKAGGTEVAITASEEFGKTVFEGFFTIRPTGTAKIEIEYNIPIKADKQYKLLIQKQPGNPGHTYNIDAFGKKIKDFPLDTDKEIIIKL